MRSLLLLAALLPVLLSLLLPPLLLERGRALLAGRRRQAKLLAAEGGWPPAGRLAPLRRLMVLHALAVLHRLAADGEGGCCAQGSGLPRPLSPAGAANRCSSLLPLLAGAGPPVSVWGLNGLMKVVLGRVRTGMRERAWAGVARARVAVV